MSKFSKTIPVLSSRLRLTPNIHLATANNCAMLTKMIQCGVGKVLIMWIIQIHISCSYQNFIIMLYISYDISPALSSFKKKSHCFGVKKKKLLLDLEIEFLYLTLIIILIQCHQILYCWAPAILHFQIAQSNLSIDG